MTLNQRATALCDAAAADAAGLNLLISQVDGARLLDFGVAAKGGLAAGLRLAEICMAGLGEVRLLPPRAEVVETPTVAVRVDRPLAACIASQYAGWQLQHGDYFAMVSGPIRSLRGREPILESLNLRERGECAVAVLETASPPAAEVVAEICRQAGATPEQLTLCAARTASLAGGAQIAARSVETAMHKLHELGFPLAAVECGYGTAPLPPVAENDLSAIGRTNDAVLYGGEVTLWLRGDDAQLAELAEQTPSSASPDHGEPFAQIFKRYKYDFYQIDPLLFSPAVVNLMNLDTGATHRGGRFLPDTLRASFLGKA